jgi:hypothetical protein
LNVSKLLRDNCFKKFAKKKSFRLELNQVSDYDYGTNCNI